MARLRRRTGPRPGLALALLAAALLGGCAGTPKGAGRVHEVRAGETVYRIARWYGVEVEAVVEANGIRDVTTVAAGRRLLIPGTDRPAPPGPLPGPKERAQRSELAFGWPLQGRLTSVFGTRGARRHEGIDLAARPGTPVRAAERGRVIHSGWLGDYGKVVIVRHAAGFDTVYAHNRRNRARRGARVEKGEVIAELGATGNATGPHLHFEIRRRREPRDPLPYLPRALSKR